MGKIVFSRCRSRRVCECNQSNIAVTKNTVSFTTAQSLGALLKSARDIMRKDKGLNGDLDRLPMLTWIMLLTALLDLAFKGGL
jgi:hypothetical protein